MLLESRDARGEKNVKNQEETDRSLLWASPRPSHASLVDIAARPKALDTRSLR